MSFITLSHADEMEQQERINRAEAADAALGALRVITQHARAKDEDSGIRVSGGERFSTLGRRYP